MSRADIVGILIGERGKLTPMLRSKVRGCSRSAEARVHVEAFQGSKVR
jgi:hypothetical protein